MYIRALLCSWTTNIFKSKQHFAPATSSLILSAPAPAVSYFAAIPATTDTSQVPNLGCFKPYSRCLLLIRYISLSLRHLTSTAVLDVAISVLNSLLSTPEKHLD